MNFKRAIEADIEENLFKGKVIIIYGPRRAGKTFLSKELLKYHPDGQYINCELQENREKLTTTSAQKIRDIIGTDKRVIVLDEAQTISNIGQTLKIMADEFSNVQIIATGSSSFDLAQKISEPMTGRVRQYLLLPLSLSELEQAHSPAELDGRLETSLRFGHYPSVIGKTEKEMIEELDMVASTYLYKDILQLENVRKPRIVTDLVKALALQVGSEVSLNELARLLGTSLPTVARYLDLLEQSFVTFRLGALSRNPRKEIAKKFKVYFYDLGIRNSVIRNYNPLDTRSDVGALWENFCIVEKVKYNSNLRRSVNNYFWRSYAGAEIDYLEEAGGRLTGFECKWSDHRYTPPALFGELYPSSSIQLVTKDNYRQIIK
jgi:predicted AAA+ superfamily ATPase